MSKLLSVLIAAVFAAVTFSAVAVDSAMATAEAPKKMNPQHQKMKYCNKEAKVKGLRKAERKAFMKSCLKKDSAEPSAQ